jgi:hypothetical protein
MHTHHQGATAHARIIAYRILRHAFGPALAYRLTWGA